MAGKLQIYHLYHSSIAIESENHFLIFDYFNDEPSEEAALSNGVVPPAKLAQEDNIYVFATHSHGDHFNPLIFEWQQHNQDINYILSDDIPLPDDFEAYQVTEYQQLDVNDLTVETYGTTDQGVSLYVEVNGFNIFHAGDLNWWHWKKFAQAKQQREEEDFKREVDKLAAKDIDVAFIPVDPRLEEHYALGGRYFAKQVKPELIVPIHFRDNYEITGDFAEEIADLPVGTAVLSKRGAKLSINQ
ncbi:MAG: MBL fold metallo-hydrolase [Bacillota bacterium]